MNLVCTVFASTNGDNAIVFMINCSSVTIKNILQLLLTFFPVDGDLVESVVTC